MFILVLQKKYISLAQRVWKGIYVSEALPIYIYDLSPDCGVAVSAGLYEHDILSYMVNCVKNRSRLKQSITLALMQ